MAQPVAKAHSTGEAQDAGGWTPPFGAVLTNVREASEGEELSS